MLRERITEVQFGLGLDLGLMVNLWLDDEPVVGELHLLVKLDKLAPPATCTSWHGGEHSVSWHSGLLALQSLGTPVSWHLVLLLALWPLGTPVFWHFVLLLALWLLGLRPPLGEALCSLAKLSGSLQLLASQSLLEQSVPLCTMVPFDRGLSSLLGIVYSTKDICTKGVGP